MVVVATVDGTVGLVVVVLQSMRSFSQHQAFLSSLQLASHDPKPAWQS